MTSPVGGEGWRLVPSGITFGLARSDVEPERNNRFFQDLYRGIGTLLAEGSQALFGFEGREHTAQVEGDLRELRESRFRFGADDQKLAGPARKSFLSKCMANSDAPVKQAKPKQAKPMPQT